MNALSSCSATASKLVRMLYATQRTSHVHSISIVGEANSFGDSAESPNPFTFPIWQGGSSFPGMIPSEGMVSSNVVLDITPSVSGVVVGYLVDEFTCASLVEN